MKKKTSKYEERTKSIPFYNNKGDRIFIPEDYTIEDLVKILKVREIKIEKKGSFLPDGWYSNEKPKKQQTERKNEGNKPSRETGKGKTSTKPTSSV